MTINIPASMYRDGSPQELTAEQEDLKKNIYDTMPQRRRKFIDRIGYENWDPFPKPNDPMELRTDSTKRSTQQLMHEFLKSQETRQIIPGYEVGASFKQGALEMALGIVNRDEKHLGMFEFSVWYYDLLKKEKRID